MSAIPELEAIAGQKVLVSQLKLRGRLRFAHDLMMFLEEGHLGRMVNGCNSLFHKRSAACHANV